MTPIDYNTPNDMWQNNDFDPYKGLSDEERFKVECVKVVALIVTIIVGLALCALLGSCTTTKYVTMPEYHTDTVRVTQYQRDSIYMHDSILVRQQGDTVTIDRWHIEYRDRWHTDTIYKSRVDSVPYKVEVIKEVPAKLSLLERVRRDISDIIIGVIALMIILFLIRRFAS